MRERFMSPPGGFNSRRFASFALVVWLSLTLPLPCFSRIELNETITLGDKDNGRSLTLRKGDTLIVKLGSQPGTGYGWRIAKNDAHRLKFLGESVESPDNGSEGGTELQAFRFEAQSSGSTVLELHYVRPWEKGVAPLKTYCLKVQVRES